LLSGVGGARLGDTPGGRASEVEQIDAAIWTVREGKIARAEFYTDRDEAFRAAGIRQ